MSTSGKSASARRALLLLAAAWLAPLGAAAQELPPTRIFLAPLDGREPGFPRHISPAGGYNNQPHFGPGSSVLYFTAEQAGGQTDILAYSIADGSLDAVLASSESEYSPTPIPRQNALSVVRVEPDGRQRLWRIDLGTGTADLLLPNVEPVGYHAWYGDGDLALFLLGETFTLHRAKPGPGSSSLVYTGIGRTLKRASRSGQVLIVDKNEAPWAIASVDMQATAKERLSSLFPGVEDFEAGPGGVLWQGLDSKLYVSSPQQRWRLAADWSEFGVEGITRIAVSPDGRWIAVVGSEREAPASRP